MKLLIPGPVSTQAAVRAAAALDYAPWDNDFRPLNVDIRARVLGVAGTDDTMHATLPLQGCGHFAMEAALRTFVPHGGRILIPATGAYADRAIRLAREIGCDVATLPVGETERADPAALEAALLADPTISHAVLVYSETGSGIIHDVPALAQAAARAGRRVIVDAVSAFGALPLSLRDLPMVDGVVFTANKCLEGLPGLAFVIGHIGRLVECQGRAGSWSFDLADIYQHALRVGWGSFRFTPPAQVMAAFQVALDLYQAEGGQPARLARYTENMGILYDGMRALGLRPYLPEAMQGPIVVNIHAPEHAAWSLQGFVDGVKSRGFVVSNFYNTKQPSFRVGCIGAISPADMRDAVAAMGATLAEMGIGQAKAA
ncbi:2-aminoethylphosphonate--pyruvate transaminase [Acidisphaera sp. L21]|uniref:2-aminoethylphosphonate--pyruvate transaminase n=1 Tax=Acidisphaera sp. L21 TaxID=1641851 RepID=UPI00131C8CB0|nr:2-aminoethylphosphonate--pyruvate transaminase [Acidisphaera sp. L21]